MSAAQTAGTPAPAVVAAPPAPEVGGEQDAGSARPEPTPKAPKSLAEKLKASNAKMAKAGLSARDTEAAAAEGPEPEAPEAKPAPADISAEQLFSDDALATPEGLQRAREVALFAKEQLEKRTHRLDRFDIKLKTREKTVTQREQTIAQRESKLGGAYQFLTERGKLLTNPGAKPLEICQALAELTGRREPNAGRELAEQIMLAIARDGEPEKETPGEKRQRERIEAIERERQAERAQWEEQRQAAEVSQLRAQVQQTEQLIARKANDPIAYPGIAGAIAKGATTAEAAAKWIGDYLEDAMQSGEPLDIAEAIGTLNSRLEPYAAQRATQVEDGGDQPEEEVERPQAPRKPARQPNILPSDADRSSAVTRKNETQEQRRARLARDPDFLKRSGLSKFL